MKAQVLLHNYKPFIYFLAYDVGVNLLSASGNERKILTADGGSIRIKQVGFVNQGDNLSICIENDDSLLHVYQGPGQNIFIVLKSDVPCQR